MTPNQYIQENYSDIKKWLYNITRGERPHLYDDFLHEVIMIFLQHDKAQDAIDSDTARFFLVRIGLNQWRSSTSTFHYQYRDSFLDTEVKEAEDEEYDVSLDVMEELAISGLEEMYQGTSGERYEAIIIMMYFANNSNYSLLGRQLGMPHTTIRKIYLRGIEKLRNKINNKIKQIQNGTINNRNLTNISNMWDSISSDNKQQTISLVNEIFKTKYFRTI
jgi:DNA-directed RNA polymerase specialized sigma24 family protein